MIYGIKGRTGKIVNLNCMEFGKQYQYVMIKYMNM